MVTDDLDSRVAELYALPLGEFTAARNALSKALRDAGQREGAQEVGTLRKPTLTAWAVNQLIHHYPDVWTALLEATARIRDAHATGPEVLSAAIAERRAALGAAVETTAGILGRAGGAAAPPQIRRITGSLEALASGAAEVLPGRLSEDLEPPGFGGLAGLELAPVPRPASKAGEERPASRTRRVPAQARAEGGVPGKEPDRAPAALEKATRELEGAEAALAEAVHAASHARDARAEAERQAADARAATDVARAEAEAARARLLEAQAAQAGLERRLKKLAAEEASAHEARKGAQEAVREARAKLDRL